MIKLCVEGWRKINHSYAIVNQKQLIEFSKLPIYLRHKDIDFASKDWSELENSNGFSHEENNILDNIKKPLNNEVFDITLRISFPYNFEKNTSKKLFIFGTSEYQNIDGHYIKGDPKKENLRKNLFIITSSNWSKKGFVKAGFEHIIPQGIDHILFVLGLFFSCITFRALLWQVTAFTVAHSITLILAAQGFVQLRGDIVEAIIALSIVWVAIENVLFKETSKWRYSIVFAFGLLHGLGFAALLTQYGLPKDNFISMLLAFNIGVEFGQLAVLLLAFILIKLIMKKNWYSNEIKIPASLIIAAIGLFWFIERII